MEDRKIYRLTGVSLLLIFVFIIFNPVLSWSATVSGKITDKSDGSALFGATVGIKSVDNSMEPTGTAADENGEYIISKLPAGEYIMTISSVGFTAQTLEAVTLDEAGTKTIDIGLKPSFINLNAVSVTASRRTEKINEAPASVSVVESEAIEERATLTPTDHIKGLPSVDVASTGLNQSNAVVRGFNNIFSGALLVLTDNRIARVPSLRFNAYNFISIVNSDIERIEVVSGPGSALYGPNAASGVMHMITKSPFAYPGTRVTIGGGERNLMLGSIRHAGVIGDRIGYKIAGQYYQGDDWKHREEQEQDSIALYRPTSTGNDTVSTVFENKRNFDVKKYSGEGRIDFAINNDTKLILSGGLSRASSIELTGLGAGQAIDWTYSFAQAQLNFKDLYIQGFVNMSDAGDTYLLNTGQMIVDKSKLWVGQIQHHYAPNNWLSLTYGFDALFTRPNTESTINGRNEEDDNINEFGVYLQSEVKINDQLKFVGAARVDENNRLEDKVFSPRAALVYKAAPGQNLRITYNRAYSTPDNNNLYLDIIHTNDFAETGALFNDALHYSPAYDIRVQGVPETGFNFRYSDDGNIMYRSPFTAAVTQGMFGEDLFIELNDSTFTNGWWNVGREAVLSGINDGLTTALDSGVIIQAQYDAIWGACTTSTTRMVSGVDNTLLKLNMDQGELEPSSISDIADIGRLKPSITNTFEIGYNGLLGDRFKFSIDAYRTEKNDFIGPLAIETPNVFLDPTTLQTDLYTQFSTHFAGNPVDEAILTAFFDDTTNGGNGDGSAVDELTRLFTEGAARIPFGTVTPEGAYDPTAVLVTYRNFGKVVYYGTDFSFGYRLNQHFSVGGSYSYISKNHFEKDADNVNDINLNAPKHKFSMDAQYRNQKLGLTTNARLRFVDSFEMDSPFYGDMIDAYGIVDLNVVYDFVYQTQLSLTVQNILDNRHIEFVGGPELGRLAIMRLSRSF